MQVNGDTSMYSKLIEKKPLNEWGSLGNEGSNRLSRLWVEHHNESFYLTLAPCVAIKYRLERFWSQGLLLRRAASEHSGSDWLLCKVEFGAPTVPVTVHLEKGEVESRISCHMIGGTELLHKVVNNQTTWRQIARMLLDKVNLFTLQFIFLGKIISRAFWDQSVVEQVVPVEVEWSNGDPPTYPSSSRAKAGTATTGRPKKTVEDEKMKVKASQKIMKRPSAKGPATRKKRPAATFKRPSAK